MLYQGSLIQSKLSVSIKLKYNVSGESVGDDQEEKIASTSSGFFSRRAETRCIS